MKFTLRIFLISFLLIFSGCIFLLDKSLGSHVILGPVYGIVIFYTWVIKIKHITLITGLICSALTIIACYQHGFGDSSGINTISALISIWVTVILVYLSQKGYDQINDLNQTLKEKVVKQSIEIEEKDFLHNLILDDIDQIALVTLNRDNVISTWNKGAKQLFGQKIGKVIGSSLEKIFPDHITENIWKGIASHNYTLKDIKIEKENGEIAICDVFMNESFDDNGDYCGIGIVFIDKTLDLKIIEAEKKKAIADQKRQEFDDLVKISSHNIREPLSRIENVSFLLKRIEPHSKETGKYLDFLEEAIQDVYRVNEALIDFANVGHNMHFEHLDLNEIIGLCINNLGLQSNIELDNLPSIIGPRNELITAFTNILENCKKFKSDERNLLIKVQYLKSDNEHTISIIDNGFGIKEDLIHQVFKLFRVANTNKNLRGQGIGLPTSKKIIELLKGSIEVESIYNQSCTVRVKLPVS